MDTICGVNGGPVVEMATLCRDNLTDVGTLCGKRRLLSGIQVDTLLSEANMVQVCRIHSQIGVELIRSVLRYELGFRLPPR
jgi:hypothetical protein